MPAVKVMPGIVRCLFVRGADRIGRSVPYRLQIPFRAVPDHRVRDDDKLSRHGDHDDLVGLSLVFHPPREGFQNRVVPGGDDGRLVQNGPQVVPSAVDAALALLFPAVAGEVRQARQGRPSCDWGSSRARAIRRSGSRRY